MNEAPPPASRKEEAAPPDEREPPGTARVLNTAALAIFASSLFIRAVDPVIPQIAGDFALDTGTVALLSTAFALPYALVQPVLGALADTLGKARLMNVELARPRDVAALVLLFPRAGAAAGIMCARYLQRRRPGEVGT